MYRIFLFFLCFGAYFHLFSSVFLLRFVWMQATGQQAVFYVVEEEKKYRTEMSVVQILLGGMGEVVSLSVVFLLFLSSFSSQDAWHVLIPMFLMFSEFFSYI